MQTLLPFWTGYRPSVNRFTKEIQGTDLIVRLTLKIFWLAINLLILYFVPLPELGSKQKKKKDKKET